MKYAEQFASLLEGLSLAYGKFTAGEERADGKRKGKMIMVSEDLSEEKIQQLWEGHLLGTQSIGIVPIQEDNNCMWGAIDIDDYTLDIPGLAKQLHSMKLPLIPCRSKSGGAHLYLFLSEKVSAALLQSKLREIASAIGKGQSEIFPKQKELLIERGDRGNCLNMPYFGGDSSTRYGVGPDGESLSMKDFVKLAEKYRISKKELKDITFAQESEELEWIADGPPCLQQLANQGFPQGTRNNSLFNIGVYLIKRYEDDWETKLEEINHKAMQPPLGASEIVTLQKTLSKKEYNYRCNEQPIVNHCNSALCRTKKFGIGSTGGMPQFGTLSKYESDPPIWFLDVEDGRLELETEDLQNQLRFQRKCMNALNTMPPILKSQTWQGVVQQLLANAEIIEVSNEVSIEGQFHELLEAFCTDRAQARNRDELLLGKPWTESQTTHFRLKDLQNFLARNNFKEYSRTQITARIIKMNNGDAKSSKGFFNIKGKGVNVWTIPEYQSVDSAYDTSEEVAEDVL